MEFLVIDDDKTFREATCLLVESEGHTAEAASSGAIGLKELKEGRFNSVLLDLNLGLENGLEILEEILQERPQLPVIMFSAQSSARNVMEAMQRGAVDFVEKPFTREQFYLALARVQRIDQLNRQIEQLEREVSDCRSQYPALLLETKAPQVQQMMEIVRCAAKVSASILILGECGTGKSMLARTIHAQSHLSDKPFVTISCPSLAKEPLESELFGHVKGAFTGALKDRWGKVRVAAGGTLFLDEIGDLPMDIQPKLLRLLQEGEYERMGENTTRRAEVRIICATMHDLKKRVTDSAFREDLYSRLNGTTVHVPPLRERPDDLVAFAEHYRQHFAPLCGRCLEGFTSPALAGIRAYSWPGNLRELRNVVEHAVIMTRKSRIDLEDLPIELRGPAVPADNGKETLPQVGGMVSMEQLEEAHLRKVMERTSNLAKAAHVLGIDQATLYRKRKKFGLE